VPLHQNMLNFLIFLTILSKFWVSR
jgi:hypothetical protein